MAWTVKATIDDDKHDVGVLSAIWDAGLPTQFSYSERIKMIYEEVSKFIDRANAALKARADRVDNSARLTDIAQAMFNAKEL